MTATMPDWLSFVPSNPANPVKSTLVGTPISSDVGDHIVVITATDDSGLSATQSFNITVNTPSVVVVGAFVVHTYGASNSGISHNKWRDVDPSWHVEDGAVYSLLNLSFDNWAINATPNRTLWTQTLTAAGGIFEYDSNVVISGIKAAYVVYTRDRWWSKSLQLHFRLDNGVLQFQTHTARYIRFDRVNYAAAADPKTLYDSVNHNRSSYMLDLVTLSSTKRATAFANQGVEFSYTVTASDVDVGDNVTASSSSQRSFSAARSAAAEKIPTPEVQLDRAASA